MATFSPRLQNRHSKSQIIIDSHSNGFISAGVVCHSLTDQGDAEDELEESRSMRLLQPRLRILMYVYKRGSVPDNISQLSRALGYIKDSWINGVVNEVIDKKYLQRTKVKGAPSIIITPEGRQKIAPLILPKWLAVVIAVLSLIPMIWALDVGLLHTPVTLPALVFAGISMFLISIIFSILSKNLKGAFST